MVSRRKVKKAEKMEARKQGMTLDEAYEILDKEPSLVSKSVYEEALKLVEAEDAGFAAEIREFNKAKAKEDALRAAYQIVGGYKNTISSNLYARALALVEADDPAFAQKLQSLFENGTTFKDASDEQLATAEQIVQNAKVIEHEYNNDAQLKEDVFSNDMRLAVDNTIVSDISEEDKENTLFKAGQQEVITEITKDADFAQAEPQEKRKMLIGRIRDSIKRTLIRARLSSGAKPRDAIDFSKKVKVVTKSVTDAYEIAYKRTSSFINRLSAAGHKKAAIWLNKAKTKAHKGMVTIATTSVLLSSLLPSCTSDSSPRTPLQSPRVQKTVVTEDTTKTSAAIVADTIKSDTIKNDDSIPVLDVNTQAAVVDSISVPTEWNENMGITSAQWNRLQTYWGSREKFETFYNKITNDMLAQDGIFANKTREQVLFQYERMSSWNLPKHQETIEAFDAFFGDCGGTITKEQAQQLDDVLSDGSIKDVTGTLNTRVTGRNVDCEEGSVLQVQNFDKKETTGNQTNFSVENDGGSSVVVDESNTNYNVIEESGSTRTVVEETTDTVAPAIRVFKSNSLNGGVQIGTTDADKIVTGTVTTKKDILVENKDIPSQTTTTKTSFTFEDENVTTSVSATDSLTMSSKVSSFTFEEEQGSSTTVHTDSISASKGTPSFVFEEEIGSSTVVLADNSVSADSAQIVVDSEDLPRGTPAAGNVPERGGYENSGLISKRQHTNLQGWYVTKYGDNAFDDVMEKITDDMLAKGGAFEGLSKEQALRVAEGIMVHSNLFPESAEALEAFLNPCKDAQLTVEQIEQIRKDGYNITEEGLVTDGVYNKSVYARFYKTGDCEEDGRVVYENMGRTVSTTKASNQYYGRLYQYKPQRTEPITFTFGEETGSSRTEVKHVYKETEPVITKHKGNGLDDKNSKYLGEVSAEEIVNAKTSSKKNILIEQSSTPVTFTFEEEKGSTSTNFVFEEEKGKTSFVFEEENSSAKTVTSGVTENVQSDTVKKVKEDKRKQSKSSGKAKKGGVKKKSKKQIEEEALKMARLDYWKAKLQNN